MDTVRGEPKHTQPLEVLAAIPSGSRAERCGIKPLSIVCKKKQKSYETGAREQQ